MWCRLIRITVMEMHVNNCEHWSSAAVVQLVSSTQWLLHNWLLPGSICQLSMFHTVGQRIRWDFWVHIPSSLWCGQPISPFALCVCVCTCVHVCVRVCVCVHTPDLPPSMRYALFCCVALWMLWTCAGENDFVVDKEACMHNCEATWL